MLEPRRLLAVITDFVYKPDTAPHQFEFTYDQNVAQGATIQNLRLQRIGVGSAGGDEPLSKFAEVAGSSAAQWNVTTPGYTAAETGTVGQILPDGNYDVILSLPGNQPPLPEEFVADLETQKTFFFNGDFTRDRNINLDDFTALSAGFGVGTTFQEGDSTFDGVVDLNDFTFLSSRFGTSYSAPPIGPNSLVVDSQPNITTLLQWEPPKDLTGILGYRIWRSFDGIDFGSVVFTINDPERTSWVDGLGTMDSGPALPDATKIWYRLRAFTAAGNSVTTNKEWGVTILPAPTDISFYNVTQDRVTLSWSDNSQNETHFVVQRRVVGGSWGPEVVLPANTIEYADPDTLAANTQYEYRVFAKTTTYLQQSMPVDATVSTLSAAAVAPSNVRATPSTPFQIAVEWDQVDTAVGFKVERRRVSGSPNSWVNAEATTGDPDPILAANITNILDKSLSANTAYLYRVRTIGADGSTALSPEVTVTTFQSGGTAPAAVANVIATPEETKTVVTWNDQSGDELGFNVYRSQDGAVPVLIGTAGVNVTSFDDTEVSTGGPEVVPPVGLFSYSLSAFNTFGAAPQIASAPVQIGSVAGDWLWETNGEAVASGNAIKLGVIGRGETAFQPSKQHAASLLLEPSATYTLRFEIDWHSWDTCVERFHNGNGQGLPNDGGFWDIFSIGIASQKYINLPVSNAGFPLTAPIKWGGTAIHDGTADESKLEHYRSTITRTFQGNLNGSNYLNIALDTDIMKRASPSDLGYDVYSAPGAGQKYPSWGTVKVYLADLQVDSNNDGVTNVADQEVEDDTGAPGKIVVRNNDDDNENDVVDEDEAGTSLEDDLVPLKLRLPSHLTSGVVRVAVASNSPGTRIWDNPLRSGTPYITPASRVHEWQIGSQPSTLWVEAVGGSSVNGSLRISASTGPSTIPTTGPGSDAVRLTAADVTNVRGGLGNQTRSLKGNEVEWNAQPIAVSVLRNSGTIELSATMTQNLAPFVRDHLKWAVVRNANDSQRLQGIVPPAVNWDAQNPMQATLTTDSVGSFSIVLFDDTDGVANLSENDAILKVFKVIQVDLKVVQSAVAAQNLFTVRAGPPAAGGAATTIIEAGNPVTGEYAYNESATIELNGGGTDEKLGLGQINLGWLANGTSDNVVVGYANNHQVRDVLTPGNSFPVLDAATGGGGGAATAFRATSTSVLLQAQAAGQRRMITAADAPNFPILDLYPGTNDAANSVTGSLAFREFAVGFSDAYDRTYVAGGTVGWSVSMNAQFVNGVWQTQNCAVAADGNTVTVADPTKTVEALNGVSVGPVFKDVLTFDFVQ